MRPLVLVLACVAFGACGPTAPDLGTGVADAELSGARNAVELLRLRYPALIVEGEGEGARLSIRRTGTTPVIVLNGSYSSTLELSMIPAERVTNVEILTTMAETMVYGQDAALAGVLKVTAKVGR